VNALAAPPSAEPAPAIRAEGLTKSFPSGEALASLTFEVAWGEVFGLTGPNGCGKTTALRVLAGLCRPDKGWAEVAGADVISETRRLRWLVGYVPDHFGVYESMTAAEYLSFYASCYRLPRKQAARAVTDLLALVGLSAKSEEQVNYLSRGMKQRLCLARALVHDPQVLLLDEPASGLDPRARAEVVELIAALGEMGKAVVITSHILPELAEVCSSFGLLHEGRMVAFGPAAELLGESGDLGELYLAATGPAEEGPAEEGPAEEGPAEEGPAEGRGDPGLDEP
jgi:ABC-2 type transport system ATP-binding protein